MKEGIDDRRSLASIPEVLMEIVSTKSFWEMDMTFVSNPTQDRFL